MQVVGSGAARVDLDVDDEAVPVMAEAVPLLEYGIVDHGR